ncbi:MAG: hypothetical protein HZA31_10770 [Opitutae bacterium]|nr:hypothetical protein [Opitutae bacterium]
MNDQREQHGRDVINAIRRVLYREWDPLDLCDVGPETRYDAYISPLYRLLATAPTKEAVVHELKRLQVELIGPDFSKEKRLPSIADMLLAINLRVNN